MIRKIENVTPGWRVTFFIGCDKDDAGNETIATADRMISRWYPTRDEVEDAPYPEVN